VELVCIYSFALLRDPENYPNLKCNQYLLNNYVYNGQISLQELFTRKVIYTMWQLISLIVTLNVSTSLDRRSCKYVSTKSEAISS